MRKIILSSTGIPESLSTKFWEFINISPRELKVAYIANASDDYQKRDWALLTGNYFKSIGIDVEEIDLRKYSSEDKLFSDLSKFNLIWAGPGDVEPLQDVMNSSGFTKIIKQLLSSGIIYGGESAGAIVVGPTIDETFTKPGLGLVNFLPIPHWDNPSFKETFTELMPKLANPPYPIVKITEDQAVFVEDSNWKLLP